jgi:hypothetical protein
MWDAIESDKPKRRRDWLAISAMLRGVPPKMHSLLLNKKSAKEAWAAIKVDVFRCRESQGGQCTEALRGV